MGQHEMIRLVTVLAPDADALAGTKYGKPINLAVFREAVHYLTKGVGATGTSQVTLEACDDALGSNPVAVPFIYRHSADGGDTYGEAIEVDENGFTTEAGSDGCYQFFAPSVARLATLNKQFLRVKCVEVVNDPCDAAVVAVLTEAPRPPFQGQVFS